ncbi:MAG: hypothetical protein BGO54_17295 [Sphingobacteriales bacterium 46-32]|nr:MAG: hypothetical protein BGO54_17295 [Sphingobacteriales bacterium 46-32]
MKKPASSLVYRTFVSLIMLFTLTSLWGQAPLDKDVLIVSCRTGTLLIDGIEIGKIEAEDVTRQKLSYGEHYLQVRVENEKINMTLVVDSSLKSIVKVGCGNAEQSSSKAIRVLNKRVNLTGLIVNEAEENLIAFDKGDEIVINFSILNKKGTGSVLLKNYETGTELYKKESVNSITDGRIKIPMKGVYQLSMSTDALFGKDAEIFLDRIPGPTSSVDFNTTPKKVYDTISTEVLNTQVRAYSVNSGRSNKTLLTINLPKNTSYWVYWIGVGQESMEKMRNFASTVSKASSLISLNPLVMFGLKLIPSLPMMNATATLDYRFVDNINSQLFLNDRSYRQYAFRSATNVTTDYALIKEYASDLILAFNNNSSLNGHDVEVKVVAFSVRSKIAVE